MKKKKKEESQEYAGSLIRNKLTVISMNCEFVEERLKVIYKAIKNIERITNLPGVEAIKIDNQLRKELQK